MSAGPSAVTLGDLAAAVAAPGTDADLLARLVASARRAAREPDRIRRALATAVDGPSDAAGAAARIAAVAGAPSGPDAAGLRVATAEALRSWTGLGVRVAVVGDPGYPARLAEGWPTLDAPTLLAWRGQPPAVAGPGVAVVGARRATAYGLDVATELAAAVARAGGRVVSGGAHGIDAAAHAAALGLPGGTTVVLGCGHGVAYPRAHAGRGGLFDRILADGGTLVSELLPDVAPHPGIIRARNRIVAALAEAIVVVEGGDRSGALLTAAAAAERGRSVLAVPGDVRAPGSAAPLRLLSEGAAPYLGPGSALALLPAVPRTADTSAAAATGPAEDVAGAAGATGLLPPAAVAALVRAWPRPLTPAELARTAGCDASPLLAGLVRARIAGVVEAVGDGVRLAAAPTGGR
jgi:DNA processing protein